MLKCYLKSVDCNWNLKKLVENKDKVCKNYFTTDNFWATHVPGILISPNICPNQPFLGLQICDMYFLRLIFVPCTFFLRLLHVLLKVQEPVQALNVSYARNFIQMVSLIIRIPNK
jgi:hypothetical protein